MNLDDFVIPEDKLFDTPSREDGCSKELEVDLRTAGCDQIQLTGRILKLPQASVSTAQVIFQRFFYVRSFVKFSLMVSLFVLYLIFKNFRMCIYFVVF